MKRPEFETCPRCQGSGALYAELESTAFAAVFNMEAHR